MKHEIVNIAKAKIRLFDKKTYCGCLTPSEFLALAKAGVRARKEDIAKATRYKQKGDSSPSWYYFELGRLELYW